MILALNLEQLIRPVIVVVVVAIVVMVNLNSFNASLIYMRKPQSASLDLRVKKRKKKFYSDRSIDASFYDIELN